MTRVPLRDQMRNADSERSARRRRARANAAGSGAPFRSSFESAALRQQVIL